MQAFKSATVVAVYWLAVKFAVTLRLEFIVTEPMVPLLESTPVKLSNW